MKFKVKNPISSVDIEILTLRQKKLTILYNKKDVSKPNFLALKVRNTYLSKADALCIYPKKFCNPFILPLIPTTI